MSPLKAFIDRDEKIRGLWLFLLMEKICKVIDNLAPTQFGFPSMDLTVKKVKIKLEVILRN